MSNQSVFLEPQISLPNWCYANQSSQSFNGDNKHGVFCYVFGESCPTIEPQKKNQEKPVCLLQAFRCLETSMTLVLQKLIQKFPISNEPSFCSEISWRIWIFRLCFLNTRIISKQKYGSKPWLPNGSFKSSHRNTQLIWLKGNHLKASVVSVSVYKVVSMKLWLFMQNLCHTGSKTETMYGISIPSIPTFGCRSIWHTLDGMGNSIKNIWSDSDRVAPEIQTIRHF